MKKRILSCLMVLALCLTLLPTAALATENTTEPSTQLTEPTSVPEEQEGLAGVSAPQTGAANSEFTVRSILGDHPNTKSHCICNTYQCSKHNSISTWWSITSEDDLKKVESGKAYSLANDIELTETWKPQGTIYLCMNGHSITMSSTSATQSLIEVGGGDSACYLSITNCLSTVGGGRIRHSEGAVDGPGITVSNGGTVELFDGNITQNSDGVVVKNGGTLNVNSDISKNTGAGVRVEDGGKLSLMSSGRILDNKGCGVDVAASSNFTVSGGAEVRNNTKNDAPCNVYLHDGATMQVSELSKARIGVTVANPPTDGEFVKVTSDGKASRSDQNCITSDNANYRVFYSTSKSAGNLVLDARPTPLHEDHNSETFVNSLSSPDGELLINGEAAASDTYMGTSYYTLPEGNYYLEGDLELSKGLLAYSADVVLCLNGHNITVTGTSYVICTAKKTSSASGSYTFKLTDCADVPGTLTHSTGQGGGVYVRDGTFIMRGGKISGNNSGVYVYQGNTFEIYGGEISGNNNYGVKLTPVSGAHSGNGYIHMTVGGTAKIMGNWENGTYNAENHLYEQGTTGTARNVYYYFTKEQQDQGQRLYNYITVDSTLTEGAEIGVTIWKTLTGERNYVAVATCGTSSSANAEPYKGYFKSDNSAYKVWSRDNNVVIGVRNSEDQIHPVCGKVCSHKNTDGKPLHPNIVWTPVSDALGLNNNGDNIYLTDDIELTKTWQISADGTVVNLCLNGHTIKANGDFDAITLTSNTNTLNICDCSESGSGKLTHGTKGDGTTYSGAGVYMMAAGSRKATVNMYGGTITGNTGHAVEIKGKTSTRGGGVYVDSNAQFSMRGGSITGNTADVGGGVYYTASNSLFVSGKVNITGNKNTDNAESNVYVLPSSGTPKTVPFYIGAEGLAEEAKIGVWAVIKKGTYSPVAQLAPYADKANAYHKGNFILDNGGDYGFKLEDSEYSTLSSTVVNLYNGVHKHPICGETCTDGAHTGDSLTWTGISTLDEIDTTNKGFNYYLTQDITLSDKAWEPANGVNLCLNGYSIKAEHISNIITVAQGKTFTLTDCNSSNGSKHFKKDESFGRWVQDDNGTITVNGGAVFHPSKGGLGVDVAKNSTFTMYGGTICGNSGGYDGGGVSVNGTFHMSGGTICGNVGNSGSGVSVKGTFSMSGRAAITGNTATYSGGGVYVDKNGTFNMSGGAAITGNGITQSNGGGVYVSSEAVKMNVSGDVKIENNWKKGTQNTKTGLYEKGDSGSANNLCLNADKTVTIDDSNGLSSNAHIGVTTQNASTGSNQIKIATGATKELSYYTNIFTPDVQNQGYMITKNENENALYLSGHQHSWGYTNDGADTIKATCTDPTCTSPNGGSVTINKPEHEVYGDSKSAEATLTKTNWTAGDVSIAYKEGESPLSSAPTNAGTYKASFTMGDKTASVTYEIKKATPTADDFIFAEPKNPTYNGEVKIADFAWADGVSGMGKIGICNYNYAVSNDIVSPIDAGTYTVKITVAEGTNYKAVEAELTKDSWTFTIAKGTYGGTTTPKTIDIVKGRSTAQSGTLTATDFFPEGTELPAGAKIASVTPASGTMMASVTVNDGTLTYTSNTNITATENESYTVTISTTNYNNFTVTLTFRPADKQPQTGFGFKDVVDSKVTKTYGDPDFKFEATGQVSDSKEVLYFSSAPTVATVGSDGTVHILKVSTTPITITAKASETTEFAETTASYTLTVAPKTLAANDLEFKPDSTFSKVYDGNETCTTANVQIKAAAKVNASDELPAVTGTYAYNSPNVKEANAVIFTSEKSDNTNYTLPAGLTVTQNASITPADQVALTVTSTTATYGTDLTLTTDGGNGDGAVTYAVTNGTGEATIVDGSTLHPTKAGTVFVTATKAGGDNYEDVTSAAKEITIGKADYTGTASKTVNIVKDRGTAQTGTLTAADFFPEGQMPADAEIANVTPRYGTIIESIAVDGTNHKLDYISKTNITATGEENYTVTIATTNYKDIEATLTFHPTNKISQDGFEFENGSVTKTYGDEDFTLTATGEVKGSTVTYESSKPEVAKVDSATGKVTILKAGSTVITATAAETADYEQATATYTLTVEKKTVTVKAKDQTAYVGDEVPALGADSCIVSGLVGGDTLTTQPTVKYVDADGRETTPDMNKTGEVKILASGAVASDNYTISYVDGKLTVSTRPSGGGSRPSTNPVQTEVSKDPDGSVSLSKTSAAKGDKVTITVKPDRHYEVDEVIVRDSKGKQLAVKDNGDGTFTFEMPADKVTVEPTFSWVNPFADVADSAYYVDAVEWMLKREVTQGTTETTFSPNLNCTRAQIVTFLWRAAGSPEPKGTVGFADVSADSYYAKAVAWAIENGITGGTGDGLFSPDATCTRAQSATFLYRAAGSPAVSGSAGFSDVAADAYYAKAVAWAKEHGITDGIGGGLFGSANDCTRAQIVTFLWRLYAGK